MKAYIAGDKKAINGLNVKYRNKLLHSVRFGKKQTMYGEVDYFKKCLVDTLGKHWAKNVLDTKVDVDIPGVVKRLGKPGRQGTVILLTCGGKKYAVKVTRKGTSCGDGATGGMGFLKQARLQELASKYKCTCPVLAVFCGHKKSSSFMVMPPMKDRLVDIYKKGETLSEKHQRQLWNIYLAMDTSVGVIHNDSNCLNIMTDMKNNIKLIDFDRSAVIEKKHIVKYGAYVNLDFMNLLGCFTKYSINPGKILMKKYCDLFNQCVIPTKKHYGSLRLPHISRKPAWDGDTATKA
jgi:serine/threonine protein kinase